MVNICMIAKDRPRLTQQTLSSLIANTPPEMYNLTIVDDNSDEWRCWPGNGVDAVVIQLSRSKGIVGFARNFAIRAAEQYWGRGDFLVTLDNDLFCLPGWLEQMVQVFELVESSGVRILGGVRHPYHGVNQRLVTGIGGSVAITDAVAGYCHMMRWATYDKYGPYPQNQVGTGASEDYKICRDVVDSGGLVGYIEPAVMHNCGVTNSEGRPATGSEAFPRVPGIVME